MHDSNSIGFRSRPAVSDDGTFGICEECGEPISMKRLEARPETTLCIRCKEDQERNEKAYG
jgi:DnaK suppressor protein